MVSELWDEELRSLARPNRGWFFGIAGLMGWFLLDRLNAPTWVLIVTALAALVFGLFWPLIQSRRWLHVGSWIVAIGWCIVASVVTYRSNEIVSQNPIPSAKEIASEVVKQLPKADPTPAPLATKQKPSTAQRETTPPEKPMRASVIPLVLDCSVMFLPTIVPDDNRINVFSIFLVNLKNMKRQGLSQMWWGDRKHTFPLPNAYRCSLSNYSSDPIYNVNLDSTTVFQKVTEQGGSGETLATLENFLSIPKVIDHGKPFEFWVWNGDEFIVTVEFSNHATARLINSDTDILAEVRQTGMIAMGMFPDNLPNLGAEQPAKQH